MRYYKLEYGCDNKEVGSQYPQVWDFIKGYSPENIMLIILCFLL